MSFWIGVCYISLSYYQIEKNKLYSSNGSLSTRMWELEIYWQFLYQFLVLVLTGSIVIISIWHSLSISSNMIIYHKRFKSGRVQSAVEGFVCLQNCWRGDYIYVKESFRCFAFCASYILTLDSSLIQSFIFVTTCGEQNAFNDVVEETSSFMHICFIANQNKFVYSLTWAFKTIDEGNILEAENWLIYSLMKCTSVEWRSNFRIWRCSSKKSLEYKLFFT